jgi:hypothetical protein
VTDNLIALPAEETHNFTDEGELETMERYGITRVDAVVYLVGPYRYSKFADALAEAKRMATTL